MKVKELMAILAEQDPELEIVTHANNHTSGISDRVRVCLLTYGGHSPCIGIGNMSRRQLNGEYPRVNEVLDDGPAIRENW